ncbi:hypothetical protein FH972_021459 [Carpinus fangiana]|uniref:Uncharacterized protein n=1 Tax=Carpinus fangiana TaxID=176857 RepID=A0A5N6KPS1_9ROSI|nr:hypothetical protein FH972_021459 [Carpinus fangiana]
MKQQQIKGFFHQFTREGKLESGHNSPARTLHRPLRSKDVAGTDSVLLAAIPRSRTPTNGSRDYTTTASPSTAPMHTSSATFVDFRRPQTHQDKLASLDDPSLLLSKYTDENSAAGASKADAAGSESGLCKSVVSPAGSVRSKRSRSEGEDKDDGEAESSSQNRKLVKTIHQQTVAPTPSSNAHSSSLARPGFVSHPPFSLTERVEGTVAPSSSILIILSQTPSEPIRSQRTVVESSQDSEEASEILYQPITPTDNFEHVDRDYDSDSSLEILRGFTPSKRAVSRSRSSSRCSPEPMHDVLHKAERTTRSQLGTVRPTRHFTPPKFVKSEQGGRIFLEKMIKQRQRDMAAQAETNRHREALNDTRKRDEEEGGSDNGAARTELLKSLADVDDNDGHTQRLKLAMGRTEAMKVAKHWYFFDSRPQSETIEGVPPFPAWEAVEYVHLCHLIDSAAREHSFLTGFANECLCKDECPPQLRQWLWHSAFSEVRDDLAQAYMHAFKICARDPGQHVLPSLIQETLQQMGASETTATMSGMVEPTDSMWSTSEASAEPPLARLPLLLNMICDVCESLSNPTKAYILNMLLRMGMDDNVTADRKVRPVLHGCLKVVVESFSADSGSDMLLETGLGLFKSVHNLTLRSRMVSAMPDTTLKLHQYKRRLALAFFFNDTALLEVSLEEVSALAARIASKLKRLDVLDSTIDYADIAAQVLLLDIGIGEGFPVQSRAIAEEEEGGECEFNASVDEMSRQVKQLFSRIIDTGASHMGRTEAKGALERLQCRLDYAVRSKVKPKENIFDDVMSKRGLGQGTKSAAMMEAFLQRRRPANKQGSAGTVSATIA